MPHKGPSPESRKAVESLLVLTPKYGEQRLDAEPDKRLVRPMFLHAPCVGRAASCMAGAPHAWLHG
eukprot:363357-Chlamydomonas_euryale.AAC.14